MKVNVSEADQHMALAWALSRLSARRRAARLTGLQFCETAMARSMAFGRTIRRADGCDPNPWPGPIGPAEGRSAPAPAAPTASAPAGKGRRPARERRPRAGLDAGGFGAEGIGAPLGDGGGVVGAGVASGEGMTWCRRDDDDRRRGRRRGDDRGCGASVDRAPCARGSRGRRLDGEVRRQPQGGRRRPGGGQGSCPCGGMASSVRGDGATLSHRLALSSSWPRSSSDSSA